MKKPVLFVVLSIVLCLVLVVVPLFNTSKPPPHKREASIAEREAVDLREAQMLLSQCKSTEAKRIIGKYHKDIESGTPMGKEWLQLLIMAAEQEGDAAQLALLYAFDADSFRNQEEASILVADMLMSLRKGAEYSVLRKMWQGREMLKDKWLVLDADKLLMDGKRDRAIALLQSKTFQGAADVARLMRLSLFTINENPKQAWEYLNDAYRKDPRNSEVRSCRGRFLELVGKNALAHAEYAAAVQIAPANTALHNQLADFYLRSKKYAQALEVWEKVLTSVADEGAWEKALFWSKMTTPIQTDWKKQMRPEGYLQELIDYYVFLNPGEYWDDTTFGILTHGKNYLKEQQSTYWLQLVAALKEEDFVLAEELIRTNPFRGSSWQPQLELAIRRVLAYKESGALFAAGAAEAFAVAPEVTTNLSVSEKDNFFAQLDALAEIRDPAQLCLAISSDLKALLDGEEAFAAVFLAADWTEAGLQLSHQGMLPDALPSWYVCAVAQGLKQNRSNLDALEFATIQKPSDGLILLIGELLLDEGCFTAALAELEKLRDEPADVGYRANWLMSRAYVDMGEYGKAKALIDSHSRLSKDVLGQEAYARISLLEGNEDLAFAIYASIQDQSAEAKSYLAKRAFANKNWKRARQLTEELLLQYPNNAKIRDNLNRIVEVAEADPPKGER